MKGSKILKIVGIIMIVGGVLASIAGVIALLGVTAFVALSDGANAGLLYAASFLALAGGILQIIAGVKGMKYCEDISQADVCIRWGVIVAGLSVVGNILNVVGGQPFKIGSLILGLIVPGLFIYGGMLNKQS